jgi:hypothetical protein
MQVIYFFLNQYMTELYNYIVIVGLFASSDHILKNILSKSTHKKLRELHNSLHRSSIGHGDGASILFNTVFRIWIRSEFYV